MADVEELERRLSHRAFAEWLAYASVEPFGEERDDLRAGIICSVLANLQRDAKRRSEPYRPQDFMPQFGRPASTADPAATLSQQLRESFARFKRA